MSRGMHHTLSNTNQQWVSSVESRQNFDFLRSNIFLSSSWWFAQRIDRKSKEMDSVSFHASSKVSEIQTPSARRRSAIERTQQNPKSNRIRSIHRHPKMKGTTSWSTLWLVCLSFLFFLFSFLASSEIVHHRLCMTAVRERKLYYYSTDRLSSFINQRLR